MLSKADEEFLQSFDVEEQPTEQVEQTQEPEIQETPEEQNPQKEASESLKEANEEQEVPEATLPQEEPSEGSKEPESQEQDGIDYKAFYNQLNTPFKADGKPFQIKSAEEAIRLMQQGVNYSNKMHQFNNQKKYLLMLERNGLLDEGKLSYLIDLDKKNPEAIKKLVADSGISVYDLDETPNQYQAGNYQISDADMAFQMALDEVSSTPEGEDALRTIHQTWDPASKQELYRQPIIMSVIADHKRSGLYDRITEEMHRQRVLGTISPSTPFIQAYEHIGKQLVENLQPQQPLGQRVGVPAGQSNNVNPMARKLNAPRSASTNSTPSRPLSDAEFMAQFKNF